MNEKLFIPLNATKSTGTNTTSPTERPNKSIELGKWIKRFFGISSNGDSNLVLNQQGTWIPLRYITSYTAGVSQIGFINDTVDSWDINFYIAPTSFQASTGATIVSYDWYVKHWALGVQTYSNSGNETTDTGLNVSGLGEGVFEIACRYIFSDGSDFEIAKYVKVDASTNILASVLMGGATVNSVSGLVMDLSADFQQVGVSYAVLWYALPSFTQMGTGANATINVPLGSYKIAPVAFTDSVFSVDYPNPAFLSSSSITIS